MSMEPVSKVNESHLESHLKGTPLFEWCAVRRGRTPKRHVCLKVIGICFQMFVSHSKLSSQT